MAEIHLELLLKLAFLALLFGIPLALGNSQADQWVKTYKLQLSTDGTTWTDYKEGGQIKVLDGNLDRNSEVKHAVYGVLTKYLRFLPQTHQGGVCMRTEVFGVTQKPSEFEMH
ncbi:hypothetical protein pdam_00006105 [Pocillopora damicornis]|uniref:F5/8 type C domain-containing protein n=1 Tax=Pocillopora damicornis TaxID=46731 RepID=A0A3M6TDV5_POCDA|nr:hypothetical protein pdam_00006105 [Pocillopora damicornis]